MRDIKDLERKSNFGGADNLNFSQKYGKAVRPQKPSDNTQGMTRWSPGQVPQGGFRSIINFGDGNSTKISSTTKPGNAKG